MSVVVSGTLRRRDHEFTTVRICAEGVSSASIRTVVNSGLGVEVILRTAFNSVEASTDVAALGVPVPAYSPGAGTSGRKPWPPRPRTLRLDVPSDATAPSIRHAPLAPGNPAA